MYKKWFFYCIIFVSIDFSNASITKLQHSSVFFSKKLGKISVYRDEHDFHIKHNKKIHMIKKYDVDPLLRNISNEKLGKFLTCGYISVHLLNNGEFIIKSHVRGNGGGPVSAGIAYWLTKVICYGTALGATGVITTATYGAAAPILAGSVSFASGAAVTSTVVGGIGVSTGAGAVGAAIASTAGGAQTAALITGGVVSSAGSIGGAVAAVETVSLSAAAFFMALPIP